MKALSQWVTGRAQQLLALYFEARTQQHGHVEGRASSTTRASAWVDGAFDVARRAVGRRKKASAAIAKLELEPLLYADRRALLARATALAVRCPNVAAYPYYAGLASFYLADLQGAQASLQRALELDPLHADAAYALAETYRRQDEREEAWRLLANTSQRSARERTWIELANLVEGPDDFQRLLELWNAWPHRKRFNKAVQEYIAGGALRAREYERAKELWRDILRELRASPRAGNHHQPPRVNYSNVRARTALLDLKQALDAARIPFFLISGTLLGCIRENDLLGHDKDIDVGVWDDVPRAAVVTALERSGAFRVTPSRSTSIVRARHANGVAIDLFTHFRDEAKGDTWHEGVKCRWHNSSFTLVPRQFLGAELLVPADYERYLDENYGDWRTPKLVFDAVYDTPNCEITHRDELAVHVYKSLAAALLKGNDDRVRFYEHKLAELGEPQ